MLRRSVPRVIALLGLLAALHNPAAAVAGGHYFDLTWGSCGHVPGLFDLPTGVATDESGNVYMVDRNNGWVQKFTGDGAFITSWSLPGFSPAPTPFAIEVDGGFVYVADGANDTVLKYTTDGDYVLQWGTHGSGDGEFYVPIGLAVGPDHSVYVSDNENHRVQRFTPEGVYLLQWGPNGGNAGTLEHPRGLATDPEGNVYVAQHWMVEKFTGDGVYLGRIGDPYANGTIVDVARGADGSLYMADSFFNRIARWSVTNDQLETFSTDLYTPMVHPTGVALDAAGRVFVSDYGNCRGVRFQPCPVPLVTTQPVPLARPYGATAVFSVESPTALNFLWVHDDNVVFDNARTSGSTTRTLTITDFQPSDAGSYWCVMSSICDSYASEHAALVEATAPSCFGVAASPPAGMAAWWAMDPGPGNTTPCVLHPVGNKNHASLTGAAALVPGKVGTAVRCEGLGDGLHVPSTLCPRLAAASDGLSIDAWILPRAGSDANANRMILQKGIGKKQPMSSGGQTVIAPGYAFYLCQGGRLGFQMPGPDYEPVRFEPAMPLLSMEEWHHVAVTVDPRVAGGGTFYVDGVAVATFTPPSGILGNLADLYVGRFTPQWGPEFPASAFHGDIDEVEVFVTAIDSASVRKIWSAGCTGKRRVQVLTNSTVSLRSSSASGEVCSAILNLSREERSFSWSLAALAPTAACASAVPVTFTAASGSLTIPAGGRADFSATASVPPSALSAAFSRCYQLTVTDLGDGGVMTATGQLSFSGGHISGRAACTAPEVSETFAVSGSSNLETGVATFTLFNDGPVDVTVPVSVRTHDPETDGPSGILGIQGQPAGVPWTGSVFVPANGSAPLSVSMSMNEHEPFLRDEIVLAGDAEGDLASTHVAASDDTSLALLGAGPGGPPASGILTLRASPNPFAGATNLTLALAVGAPVRLEVVDVSGRVVRRLTVARLEPGEHRLSWDGRDDRGARVPAGVYLARVRSGGASAVVRLLRMR